MKQFVQLVIRLLLGVMVFPLVCAAFLVFGLVAFLADTYTFRLR